jgi:hypothetical protein
MQAWDILNFELCSVGWEPCLTIAVDSAKNTQLTN